MLVIDGDDSSSKTAAVSKLLLLSDGAAEKLVDIIIAVGRSDVRERCCGGQGVPRRPASGLARPLTHAELSRVWQRLEPMRMLLPCRATGSRTEGAELRACVECDDLLARKSPWVTARARDRMSTMLCTAHA